MPLTRPPQRAPTDQECSSNARVELEGRVFFGAWYPQMGGYCSHCWIEPHACSEGELDKPTDGFDVYVWHDGEFPFSGVEERNGRPPVRLHHCDPNQFIRFGLLVRKVSK